MKFVEILPVKMIIYFDIVVHSFHFIERSLKYKSN